MTAAASLDAPLGALPGVGPTRAAALASAGLRTIEDLLLRFPLRYEDRGHIVPIAKLRPGTATIAGEVVDAELKPTRRPRFTVFEVTVRDATGSARAVFFNQRFLAQVTALRQARAHAAGPVADLRDSAVEHRAQIDGILHRARLEHR